MAYPEKVTVDKAYFDALLRRADFHTSVQMLGGPGPFNVAIPRQEYDSLIRSSKEYELLKNALFQGGITLETLDLLISGANNTEARKDSGNPPTSAWTDDFGDHTAAYNYHDSPQDGIATSSRDSQWKANGLSANFNPVRGPGAYLNGDASQPQAGAGLMPPDFFRQPSCGAPPSSVPDEVAYEDDEHVPDEAGPATFQAPGLHLGTERRTLYFNGLSDRTTYKDFIQVIKGGKVLSVILRPERSALVTFLDGADAFLTYAKRHDIYLHSKRVEIKWADRQYKLNNHIYNKIKNGATRNILLRNALGNGLTEIRIRDDMEHIHNLIIIDITYRNGDAYVSTNSVHNALFARTCMMSRTTYKGCKVEFFRDECDVPLPGPMAKTHATRTEPQRKKAPLANRFDLLKMMDGGASSNDDEDPTTPEQTSKKDCEDTIDTATGHSVSLHFLDSETS